MNDLPESKIIFVGLTIGYARYQLEETSERLGGDRICDGFTPSSRHPNSRFDRAI